MMTTTTTRDLTRCSPPHSQNPPACSRQITFAPMRSRSIKKILGENVEKEYLEVKLKNGQHAGCTGVASKTIDWCPK